MQELSGGVSENLLSKMEATIAQNENRFQLIEIYFRPCESDQQYHSIFGEFVQNVLSSVNDLIEKCNDVVRRERKFPTEKDIVEEIGKTQV